MVNMVINWQQRQVLIEQILEQIIKHQQEDMQQIVTVISMIFQEIVGNGQQSTLVIAAVLTCLGEAVTSITAITRPFATALARVLALLTSPLGSSCTSSKISWLDIRTLQSNQELTLIACNVYIITILHSFPLKANTIFVIF